jgi:hypothetical protein
MIKLTKAQKELLDSLETGNPSDSVECFGHEWRTALSLIKKRLITVDRPVTDKLRHEDYFMAQLTKDGVALVDKKPLPSQVEKNLLLACRALSTLAGGRDFPIFDCGEAVKYFHSLLGEMKYKDHNKAMESQDDN